ncbi:22484_t:CDS:2 [Entrophospora sp. SA101]|nr:16163_t:CDS:2 [Entrophospora sp. SA101]CAJ0760054.1 22484_t:CDS:2 [Entrophospora sp. SA101]CAJ0867218.1 6662_t:CDS:2 [Entrophospora sp. SA101]CAJ0881406.1 16947_t:CDS:2 [Entrophospora sp. SA101]
MNQSSKNKEFVDYVNSLPGTQIKEKLRWYWSDFTNQKDFDNAVYIDCINFWKKILDECSRRKWLGEDVFCIEISDSTKQIFASYNGHEPIGIQCVIKEMHSKSELIPLEEYCSTFISQGWLSWIYTRLVSQPIAWTFQNLTGSEPTNIISGKWVKIDKLKESSTKIIQLHEKIALNRISDNLYTLATFKSEFAAKVIPGSMLTDTDIKVLITYLEYDLKVIVTKSLSNGSPHKYDSNPDDLVIKFCLKKYKLKLEITELDCNIITIKETSRKLHEQIQDIETRIKELKTAASKYISLKQKTLAMKYLRKKLKLDKILVKRINSLEAVETILLKIQEAVSDAEIIEGYKAGADALQNTLVISGLTIDKVDETMDHLQEVLADQKEIEDAMKSGQDSILVAALNNDVDDELEKELENLLAAEEERKVVKEEVKQPIKEKNQELEKLETKLHDLKHFC